MQTYSDWELHIVNDGGDPAVVDLEVERAGLRNDPRIRVLHRTDSTGMEAASNAGIRETHSKWIVIHDDDDSWDPNFLSTMTTALESQRRADGRVRGAVCHTSRIVERIEHGIVFETSRGPFNTDLHSISFLRCMEENLFPPISFVFAREVWSELGGFDETLPVLGDWEFNLRFLERYDIMVVPEILVFYHHRTPDVQNNYANTVTAKHDRHRYYENALRDRWMRADLASGKPGRGLLGWLTTPDRS